MTSSSRPHGWQAPVMLIADDNDFIRMSVKAALEKWGCIVFPTRNGEEALGVASAFWLDAIVLDFDMPVLNGPAAASAMRSLSEHLHFVPIICFTSRDSDADRKICRDAGMDSLVNKRGGLRALLAELAPYSPDWVPLP